MKSHALCSQQNDVTQDYRHYQVPKVEFWHSETEGKGFSAQDREVVALSHSAEAAAAASCGIIYVAPPPPSQTTPSHLCPEDLQLPPWGSRSLPSCSCVIVIGFPQHRGSRPTPVPGVKPDFSTKQDPCHSVQPRVMPLPLFLPRGRLLVLPQLAPLFTRAALSAWRVVFCFSTHPMNPI